MQGTEIGLTLLVACIVAMLSRKLRLPYSVGLVAAGIGLALFGRPIQLGMTPELIYSLLLPPLIFEAALNLKWRPFRDNLPVTLTLAFPGVLLACAIVAVGVHFILGWSWLASALFGALIAATDPVAVIATFKETRVEPRLSLLVESESLLNDGAAAVAFSILVTIAQGGSLQPETVGLSLLSMLVGSVVVGTLVAGALLFLAGRTDDHLVEITLTTIAAYGSFFVAEHLQMSGVLASLRAGLVVGNAGWQRSIAPASREHVLAFWEYAAFLANSIVFILIGGYEVQEGPLLLSYSALVAVGLVLVARAATVYPLCAMFGRSPLAVDMRYQHVLFWGGLRGALGLALALGLPDGVPEKGAIIVAAFAVVAFSIFFQGLTMPLMIKALDVRRREEAQSSTNVTDARQS